MSIQKILCKVPRILWVLVPLARILAVALYFLCPVGLSAANLPLTDLVFFGRVYSKSTGQQISGSLPGPITVKINNAVVSSDPVYATTSNLLDASGQTDGVTEFYVIRLRRFDAGTPRGADDRFVLPGDRIRIFLNGVEVNETLDASVLVTDAAQDVRLVSLNMPANPNPDSDGDGIPDAWESQFLGSLGFGAADDPNKDGVTMFMAYALGLNPIQDNSSRLPFLSAESGGSLVFFFRQSASATGLQYTVETSDTMVSAVWSALAGVTPVDVGIEGQSRILKVTVPGGIDRPRRFFRLKVGPAAP